MNTELLNTIHYYLEKNNADVDIEELKLQLFSHPDTPSLYAITETLKFLEIENMVGKIGEDVLEQIPENFLAVFESDRMRGMRYVEKRGDKFALRSSQGNERVVDKTDFLDIWNGIVLLIPPQEKAKSQFFAKALKAAPVIGLIVFLLSSLYYAPLLFGVSILSIIGLYISSLILEKELGNVGTIGDKICKVLDRRGCDKVISSNYKLGIFSFNELLFGLFIGQIITTVIFKETAIPIFAGIYAFSFLFVLISIYLQKFAIKAWCTLCLAAGFIVALQFAGFFLLFDIAAPLIMLNVGMTILSFSATFLVAALLFKIYKDKENQLKKLKRTEMASVKMKRKPEVFKTLWEPLEQVSEYLYSERIVLGNISSKNEVVLVFSTTCRYCADLYKEFEKAYQAEEADVKFVFVFKAVKDEALAEHHKMLHKIIGLYFESGEQKFLQALKDWYDYNDLTKWFAKWGTAEQKWTQRGEFILDEFRHWCDDNDIYFTPAKVFNRKLLPEGYDLTDVHFLTDVFEEEPELELV